MQSLNSDQLKQLSEFTSTLGLVFLASVAAPLFINIDNVNIVAVVLGIVLMLLSLSASLLLLKGRELRILL